jgi:hypothetical protein
MMMRKRYMLCLPLIAAMVALMAASAFAVAPIIDELPRVVVRSLDNSFPLAVNLDAYINWFPVTTATPAGANREYVGHASVAYPSGSRFHVYLYDGTAGRTLANGITLANSTNLLLASPALPLPLVATDRYGVDPYPLTAPKMLGITYSGTTAAVSGQVDVFAVVEGHIDGTQLVSGSKMMTVITGGAANAVSYGVQFMANRNSDSFAFWIPKLITMAQVSGLPPTGNNLTDLSWNGKAMRDQSRLASWTITGFEPTGANLYAVGDFTAVARAANNNLYAFFIPNDGGGMPSAVFQAKARFVSTAPTAQKSAGYRFGFTNAAATHFGSVQVIGDLASVPYGAAGTAASLRNIGHDFIARIFWATPLTLTEMSASGVIKAFANEVVLEAHTPDPILIDRDGRDYTIEIMCIAPVGASDQFIIDSLSVTTLSDAALTVAPAGTTRWTTNTLTASNWGLGFFGAPLINGEAKFEHNVVLLWAARDARTNPLANQATLGTFRAAKMVPLANHGVPAVSNKMYRTSLTIQSGGILTDGNTRYSPNLLLHQSILPADLSSADHANQISWYEFWGPSSFVKDPALATLPATPTTPGVPLGVGGPSVIKSYMWTHTVPGSGYQIFPEIAAYNTGVYNGTVWTDALGFYGFTDISVQQISNIQ